MSVRSLMGLAVPLCVFALAPGGAAVAYAQAQQPVNVPPAAAAPGVMLTPSTGDRYVFADAGNASGVQTIALTRTTEGVRFAWPDTKLADWDTALLEVRSWGAEAAPHLAITAGAGRIDLSLDPNALGLRWLNVSGLRAYLKEGTPVEIRGDGITFEPSQASLRLFANRLDLRDPILIIAPHPDDAEIAAFGLYAGRNATIVTVTSGNAGDFNYRAQISDPAEHYLMKGYLRAVDSVTVPWQGEIPPDRCFNLGYFDARLFTMRQTPDVPVPEMYGPNTDTQAYRRANIGRLLPVGSRTNTWNHLVEDLTEIFKKVKPSIVVMPHPSLDTHMDHEYAAVAAVEALEKWGGNPTFLLYTNHAGGDRYPWGPVGSSVTLPPAARADISVERVYSHPVDESLQRRKLFALETMHDLRLSPEEQSTANLPGVQRRPDYPRSDADYLRRAPRANELFFVYGRDGIREVIRTFLARSTPPIAPAVAP